MKKSLKTLLCIVVLYLAMYTKYTCAEEIITGEYKEITSNVEYDELTNKGQLLITPEGKLEVYDEFENTNFVNNKGEIIAESIKTSTEADFKNSGIINVSGNVRNLGTILNNGTLNIDGTLTSAMIINSGKDAELNVGYVTNTANFTVTNNANIRIGTLDNYGSVDITNNSGLTLENQKTDITGAINVIAGTNSITSSAINCNLVEELNVGDGIHNTVLNLENINIIESASVNAAVNSTLNLKDNASLNLNNNDIFQGNLILDGNGNITFDNFSFLGNESTYYQQNNGSLNLLNNSLLSIDDISNIKDGSINIDSTSALMINSNHSNDLHLKSMQTSGMFSALDSSYSVFYIENLSLDNTSLSNSAKFTIDINARSNTDNNYDKFSGKTIGNGYIEITDWNLGGDIFGYDAPIDGNINLKHIFDYDNISNADVNITIADKEVFTPIGWYKLNGAPNSPGGMTLDLTRFNPQVYRGQVTTIAQWMNQLAIDDMLFNHSMVLPSFKDEDGGMAYGGMMANRYAAIDPQFAPYQYSRKDGGLWYKMYGTFETL